MKITSIEPTPSPHSMKINVDETLADGKSQNFQLGDELNDAPPYIKDLFAIEGVKGLYQVMDFITLQRNPRVRWEDILPQVRDVLGSSEDMTDTFHAGGTSTADSFGEIKVFIQMFRNIPMQVKLQEGETEQRFGLPESFTNASMKASEATDNMLMERKWVEQNPRYGEIKEIGEEVVEELTASYNTERLDELVQLAFTKDGETPPTSNSRVKVTPEMHDSPNWKERYAALDRMDPMIDDLDVLNKALDDEKASIRRLATAFLGMIEEPEVLPYLY